MEGGYNIGATARKLLQYCKVVKYCADVMILQQLLCLDRLPSGAREKNTNFAQPHFLLQNTEKLCAQLESIAVILPEGGRVGGGWPSGAIVGEIEIQFIGAHCQRQPCHQLAKQIKWLDKNLRTGCRVDNEDKLQG